MIRRVSLPLSRIEGLSQLLLEAMALGKPVIALAAAGNLDLAEVSRSPGATPLPRGPRQSSAVLWIQRSPAAWRCRRLGSLAKTLLD